MRTSRLIAVLVASMMLSVSVLAVPVLAGDGKQVFTDKGCIACHGEDAATPLEAGYPRLAGQNAAYVFNQLKDVKSGARANGLILDTMKPIVEEMTEAEMRDVADWLATMPRPVGAQADHPGKKLYLTKTCVACHGKEGAKPLLKTYPALLGQDRAYLIAQAKDVQSGTRKNGASNAMQPVMHLVTAPELEAIADYLATIK